MNPHDTDPRVDFFDRHAARWDSMERPDIAQRLLRVVSTAQVDRGHQVLDVGCGTGILVPFLLAAIGDKGRIIELDNSLAMLDAARAKGFPSSVSFYHGDIHHTDLPGQVFDRILCNAAFPHFENRRQALQEMARLLRPSGSIVVSHPIGREAVNALHHKTEDVVAEDRVPTTQEMMSLLADIGLRDINVIDEAEFYLAIGWKPQ